jgi:hypothetical protein
MPLNKSASRNLPPQTLREIAHIEELLEKVKKEEWDNPVPYAGGEYPALALASMRAALLSPQPFPPPLSKPLTKAGFNPDEPRDERGRWTDSDGDPGEPENGGGEYQVADAGTTMTDANVDNSTPSNTSGTNNIQISNTLAPYQWQAVGMANDDDSATVITGSKIMIGAGSDALLPTMQFLINVTATPLDADGNVQPSLTAEGSKWSYPVQYSSGFTGQGATENNFAFQANPISPATTQWRWKVEIPPQEDTNGNYSTRWVKVYAPMQ